jgi:AcrR family transcriptional regulator
MDLSDNALDIARQENVTRILDAAERLFRHYGYAKTNVADIARDLGMSPANIYRFFSSKADIHQALARRMLDASLVIATANAKRPVSAAERLHDHIMTQHRITLETMLHENKVHEMVVVAIEQQWSVIQAHIEDMRLLIAGIIREGIEAGEFREQNHDVSAECFCSATVTLCHPQIIAECLVENRLSTPEDLVGFAIQALR